MLSRWLKRYRSNWERMRAETEQVGLAVEQWSYEALNRPAEEQPVIERTSDGVAMRFQVDCYKTLPNGDLAICVDALDGPPTLFGVKPSYRFFKRIDGTVYY